tara:strand:+ start:92 stop:511 length:420 start_codon:yes stop_codon:yes gene_type:complete
MRLSGSQVSSREFSLHLTIQSSDIIKADVKTPSKLSISCDISEVPSVHCTLIITRQNQDIGSIGSIKFEKNRPIAAAFLNLPEACFDELRELICLNSPRPASIFLKTSKYHENNNGEISMKNSGQALEIYDLSWRYPVL